jgi:hypothetical protein
MFAFVALTNNGKIGIKATRSLWLDEVSRSVPLAKKTHSDSAFFGEHRSSPGGHDAMAELMWPVSKIESLICRSSKEQVRTGRFFFGEAEGRRMRVVVWFARPPEGNQRGVPTLVVRILPIFCGGGSFGERTFPHLLLR